MKVSGFLGRGLAILTGVALLCPGWLSARDFFLQEGTEINLRLRTSVDSKISQQGDRIIATVEDPVIIDEVEVIPAGARVLGRIGEIRKPGRFGRGGRLVLAFDLIEVPGAGNIPISGSLVDLYEPDYEEDENLQDLDIDQEGQVHAGGPRKLKRLGSLAGGAGVGAAAGGGLGAAIGVAVGAGVAFVWFKGKHVELPAGTGMVMRVDRGVTVAVPDLPRTAGGSNGDNR